MSLPQTNSPAVPTSKYPFFAILFVAGVFAIFIVVYLIARHPMQPLSSASGASDDDKWRYSTEGRSGKLAEVRGKEQTAATSYGWNDQKAGVVRLPIERAMELTLQDLNSPAKKR